MTTRTQKSVKEPSSTWPFGRVLLKPARNSQPSIMISHRDVETIKRRKMTLMGTIVGARHTASASAQGFLVSIDGVTCFECNGDGGGRNGVAAFTCPGTHAPLLQRAPTRFGPTPRSPRATAQ